MLQRSAVCRVVSSRYLARQGYAKHHHFYSTLSSNGVDQQQQQEPSIRCDTRNNGRIATITISNAAKLNTLNSALLTQLTSTCQSLHSNNDLRAVVLTGAPPTAPSKPPSFIGGASIHEMHSLSTPSEATTFITNIHLACSALRSLPVPVIARINGFTLGAGLELMASCDVRIATSESSFGMPEVAVGIPSVVEAALLPGLIGWGRTRRLLYFAEVIGAKEAERWGLIEKVVEGGVEELDRGVAEWVDRLCEDGGLAPGAVRRQKALIRKWESCSIDEGIQAGIEAFADAFEHDGAREPREYMGRFLARKRETK